MIERFREILQMSGYSFTKTRKTIFTHLLDNSPITTAKLAEKCNPKINRATVYRSVELFEKLGIVNRIWHGFKSQIELSEIFMPHHHHAVCQNCQAAITIMEPQLEKELNRIAKKHNFLMVNHVLELSGYCSKCQNSK